MLYDKHSIDYQVNLYALHEMEEIVPMTLYERSRIRDWVKSGHELESNPWNYLDSDGYPLNFLQAYRLRYGCSHGPWDYWRDSDSATYWSEEEHRFVKPNEK